jgi:hypothetical protein
MKLDKILNIFAIAEKKLKVINTRGRVATQEIIFTVAEWGYDLMTSLTPKNDRSIIGRIMAKDKPDRVVPPVFGYANPEAIAENKTEKRYFEQFWDILAENKTKSKRGIKQ